MKLYEIKWEGEDGFERRWSGTQSDAKWAAKSERETNMKNMGFSPKIEIQTIEVPTDKAGLLDFLNRQCTRLPYEPN